MAYTVSDVLSTYESQLRLVAGSGGLARPVAEVGILDYELLPQVKSRFQRVNFYEGQLVLSTFLYAQGDGYQITEAIKYLVSKGCSGLVIKNVFHLQIPDGAIRYANVRNFPLVVTTSDAFLFDEVIGQVYATLHQIGSDDQVRHELDRLLLDRDDPALVVQHARTLNPSFRNEHRAVFVLPGDPLGEGETSQERTVAELEDRFAGTSLASYTNLFAPCDDGLLLVVSGDQMVGDGSRAAGDAVANELRAKVLDNEVSAAVGISEAHYELEELADAITEAIHAARFSAYEGGGVLHYADLGTRRLLLPHLASPALRAFERAVLEPLRSYDAETNSALLPTLREFCRQEQSFSRTAEALGQHENTVRRRLERIAQVTGLSYRTASQMEQLSLACQIALCREVLR